MTTDTTRAERTRHRAPEAGRAHVWQQRVSLSDLDWHGHVNNARMLAWVQDSWADLVGMAGSALPPFVAVQHTAHYTAPLAYRPQVRIETRVTDLGRTSVTGTARIVDDTAAFAEIASAWVAFDLATRRPRPLTPAERTGLARYFAPAGTDEPPPGR